MGLVTDILTLLVSLYLLNKSITFANYGFVVQVKSFTSHILIWPFYTVIPISLASFSLELIIKLYRKIKYFLNNKIEEL